MDIHITDRTHKVEQGLKDYLTEKLHKLDKVHLKVVDAHAILRHQKHDYIVEVTLVGKNMRIASKDENRDLHTAIDSVIHHLMDQLRKKKEMTKNKKGFAPQRELTESPPGEEEGV